MKTSRFDERFFESTRGRIVAMLRNTSSTVNELAGTLGLTDNAVRAHLLSLERDGLVRQSGTLPGTRKPHFAYELTPQADRLFPKAYDVLFNGVLSVLKGQLGSERVIGILQDVARSLAGIQVESQPGEDPESRLGRALKVLEAIGGSASVVTEEGNVSIRSRGCPLSAAVVEHPEVCRLAETLVAEVVGAPVQERCERHPFPRCRFELPSYSTP